MDRLAVLQTVFTVVAAVAASVAVLAAFRSVKLAGVQSRQERLMELLTALRQMYDACGRSLRQVEYSPNAFPEAACHMKFALVALGESEFPLCQALVHEAEQGRPILPPLNSEGKPVPDAQSHEQVTAKVRQLLPGAKEEVSRAVENIRTVPATTRRVRRR